MSTVTELREKQQQLVADAREKIEEITPDTNETRAKELEEQHDKAMAEFDRLEAKIERMERLNEAESRMDEPVEPAPAVPDKRAEPEKAEKRPADEVFRDYLRFGAGELDSESRQVLREMRAQSVGTSADGGYTVPQGFMNELIQSLQMWGPMLDPGVTREVVTDSGNQIDWPTSDDTSNKGAILAENSADSEQDISFGQKQIDAYKYTSKIIRVSEELMQDSAFNVEAIIRDAMGERLGRIVNEHLTTGTGSGQPNGIVTASTQGVSAAATGAITFDELIDLVHSVDPAYRRDPSVRFMFHDSTLQAIRKLKDGQGNYLWQPADGRTGEPATILQHPYVINQDMPEIATTNKTVLFGAFNRYVVRRVREFAVRRLVERYAEFYQVGFLGFGRFDGELVDTAAVKHLVQA